MVRKFITHPKVRFVMHCCDMAILTSFGILMSYALIQLLAMQL
tara:strand:- start:2946 stop:3074 length:129 start_codon:yes stop_codon:yes gene_type:complete